MPVNSYLSLKLGKAMRNGNVDMVVFKNVNGKTTVEDMHLRGYDGAERDDVQEWKKKVDFEQKRGVIRARRVLYDEYYTH